MVSNKKNTSDEVVRKSPLELEIEKSSFWDVNWPKGQKFHDMTRATVRADKGIWYILAEGALLSQTGDPPRWSEEAESFEAYWESRGQDVDRLELLIGYYQWLKRNDPDSQRDPPEVQVMRYIFEEKNIFEQCPELIDLALHKGYNVEELRGEVRKAKDRLALTQGHSRIIVRSPKPSSGVYNAGRSRLAASQGADSEDKEKDIYEIFRTQLASLLTLLDRHYETLSPVHKKDIKDAVSRLVGIIKSTLKDRKATEHIEGYLALGDYLMQPAEVIAGYKGITLPDALARITGAVEHAVDRPRDYDIELSPGFLIGILKNVKNKPYFDEAKLGFLRTVVLAAAKDEFGVSMR